MAVAALSSSRALRSRPRRADPRAVVGVFITLAALAGSVAFWVSTSDARAVLVATRDLAAGTTLRSADLTVAYVRMDDSLYQAALSSDMADSLIGRQLAEPIHAQQVLARAQVAATSGLAADQVAMTIPARPESAVDGHLRRGDSVQVLLTVIDKTRNEAHTRLILDRAQVFEIGRDQAFGSSTSTVEADTLARGAITSVTLAISTEQARQLAEARRTGELDVVLLPPPEVTHP